MLNVSTQNFQIKYIMIKSKEMIDSAVSHFRNDVSPEFIQYYLTKHREEKTGATITLANGYEYQDITIEDNTYLHHLIFQQFSLNINEHDWYDFLEVAIGQEINVVVLDGKLGDGNYLNSYILAFYYDNEYAFVNEHHSSINTKQIKRPVMLCGTSRNMLDVCIQDLKYKKQDIIDIVEDVIRGNNNENKYKRIIDK